MSCLFESLSFFFKNIDHYTMRNMICEYLLTDPKILDDISANNITSWESDMKLEDYVQRMRSTASWGGGIEIKCFCEIFGLMVNVHHKDEIIEFIPTNSKPKGIINIKYTGKSLHTR